jgi:hypothetical protein
MTDRVTVDLFDDDLASTRVGDAVLKVRRTGDWSNGGHMTYAWEVWIDGEGLADSAADLYAPARRNLSPGDMVVTLLAFLSAAAESYRAEMKPDDDSPFVARVQEWAYMNEDEIAIALCEIEEEDESC